jgi:peptidoglycan glycosyltransferase
VNRLNKNIKLVFFIFCCLFISLIVYLTYFTVYEREKLIQSSYNRRLWEQEEKVVRGTIYDVKGRPLAKTQFEGETKERIYLGGEAFGPVIGYSNRRLGRAGLEDVLNTSLLGLEEKDPIVVLRQKILGAEERGNDAYLTVDQELQKKAYNLFKGKRGALAAIDPNTGAILALVSSPGYDSAKLEGIWDSLLDDPNKPLINRATQGVYPPGSSFKIVTLAAALTHNPDIEQKIYDTPGYVKVDGRVIKDHEGVKPGNYDLLNAFRVSSNSVFIKIGLDVGWNNMVSTAENFGFNKSMKADLPVAISKFPQPSLFGTDVELAEASIGQGKILATPLQMARVAAVVANGGNLISPYIVEKIVTPLGTIREASNHQTVEAINWAVAEKIRGFMTDVVRNGTGKPVYIKGIEVAGKTGSAQNPHGEPHAWFVGFAPAKNPKIALAVVVENAGAGGKNAGPIAREIFIQYLKDTQ